MRPFNPQPLGFDPVSTVDDHGEMRVDAQNWAAAAIESKSDEKEISRAIKVQSIFGVFGYFPGLPIIDMFPKWGERVMVAEFG